MLLSQTLGIDLGTANTLIYERGKGIILNEPSVLALNADRTEIIAAGNEAHEMLGRTPGDIIAVRPLRDGVIADFELAQQMLRRFIIKSLSGRPRWLSRTRMVICVPGEITSLERRAAIEAAHSAGAHDAILMEEPLAAAIGAGMDISEPRGKMIVDIGGGTTDIAVLSLSGVVLRRTLRVGGDAMDAAICAYVRDEFGVCIGSRTAESIKMQIGGAVPRSSEITARGRSLKSGLPCRVRLNGEQAAAALLPCAESIIEAVRQTLEVTPPELAADISHTGIVLSGGGSLLFGLDKLMTEYTGVAAEVSEEPLTAVARGAGMAIEESGWLGYLRGEHPAAASGSY